jgi:hypothetical protein
MRLETKFVFSQSLMKMSCARKRASSNPSGRLLDRPVKPGDDNGEIAAP